MRIMADQPHDDILQRLYDTIAARKTADPGSSYTAKLLHPGRAVIAKKMGEEAVETAIAAVASDSDAVVAESADLLYHLLVLWVDCGVEPEEVWKKLAAREGTSGLAEKASRPVT
jgi:phosphoribosyl-ATP pyrophosphohydrolase